MQNKVRTCVLKLESETDTDNSAPWARQRAAMQVFHSLMADALPGTCICNNGNMKITCRNVYSARKIKRLMKKTFLFSVNTGYYFQYITFTFYQRKLLVAETVFKEDIRNTLFTI